MSSSQKPTIGNHYVFNNPENQTQTIGKVVNIEGDIVYYLEYLKCIEFLKESVKVHHTKFELIKTNEQQKEFAQNTLRQV